MLITLNDRKRVTGGATVLVNTDHIMMAEPTSSGKTLLTLSTGATLLVDESLTEVQKKATGTV